MTDLVEQCIPFQPAGLFLSQSLQSCLSAAAGGCLRTLLKSRLRPSNSLSGLLSATSQFCLPTIDRISFGPAADTSQWLDSWLLRRPSFPEPENKNRIPQCSPFRWWRARWCPNWTDRPLFLVIAAVCFWVSHRWKAPIPSAKGLGPDLPSWATQKQSNLDSYMSTGGWWNICNFIDSIIVENGIHTDAPMMDASLIQRRQSCLYALHELAEHLRTKLLVLSLILLGLGAQRGWKVLILQRNQYQ